MIVIFRIYDTYSIAYNDTEYFSDLMIAELEMPPSFQKPDHFISHTSTI